MKKLLVCCAGLLAVVLSTVALRADDAAQLKLQLMQTTQVNAVTEPLDKFVPDKDPNTLEIVMMSRPEDGPSRVSDDGEVIYLSPNATAAEQSDLIGKAFDLRVKLRLAAKK